MKTTLLLSVLCAVMAVAASQACGSDTCATDEDCDNSTNTCQCNTSLYPFVRGSLPSPNITCTGENFNIQVSKCWLEKQGYSTSDIRLNSTDPECLAVRQNVNGISEMIIYRPVISSLCNTVPVMNATHVTYTNLLYIFAKTYPIQITNDATVNVSCSYPLNLNIIRNKTTIINGPSGNGSYVALMTAYTDNTFTTPLSDSDNLQVEDTVYISVQVPDLDVNAFKLKVVNIYASPTNSSDKRYYLLQNGCPGSDVSADQLTVESNGVGAEARFDMKVFQIANSNAVYLFADLALCTTDCATNCDFQSRSLMIQPVAGDTGTFLNAAVYNYVGSSARVAASASCESNSCADDEYCDNSTTTCQCNTTLYTYTGSLPPVDVTCTGANFNLKVSKCWLEANGYNTSDIRLNSTADNCWALREVVGGTSEMTIYRPLITSDCNTEAVVNATHVTYTNQLYIFAKTDPIQITNDVIMDISCSLPLTMNVALNVALNPILRSTEINGPTANGSYAGVVMMAFTDSTYATPLSDSVPLTVEDNVYIAVYIPDLDATTFKLNVLNIYASPTESSDKKYFLLQNGCPSSDVSADELTVINNGNGSESRFPMKVFKIASSANVYLYVDLRLCTTDCTTIEEQEVDVVTLA
ncbi:pancreatic secretory granule membrane major glycoprotein GP2-like [Rana temporaria]|uniref:pancreatic secretory granule membrane major glycoprotein GP2-like n=1 Tax=Rana temporaria TaxID=8407 RepID=UPI001AACEB33|nr:pancreatic secretory granule membrane major glycoprotein GP2-like [Rana temporaria]